MEVCLVCATNGVPLTLLTVRGLNTITKFAKVYEEISVLERIQSNSQHQVHKDCQRNFTNKRRMDQGKNNSGSTSSRNTRSNSSDFCWKSQCLFCEEKVCQKKKIFTQVKNLEFRDNVFKECTSRLLMCSNDLWASCVNVKLSSCFDLVAVGATYHKYCRLAFSKGQQLQTSTQKGRPTENDKVTVLRVHVHG